MTYVVGDKFAQLFTVKAKDPETGTLTLETELSPGASWGFKGEAKEGIDTGRRINFEFEVLKVFPEHFEKNRIEIKFTDYMNVEHTVNYSAPDKVTEL
jgi:hypothetical protein